ncbi:uncharacterized protein BDR25DRAFT_349810 [Lindgomyces ingoldianus]|uniref:Uncharacterized protein n=1 Tax=Lindgomyces ingoldianus TaxID=673940 RepID=A0ACB6RE52_9PLEO|nr:uncharacterized protein BDR25DRAFT_349810 [Lindgomyces ingoldianus]KAF2476751.1 hypothetical protein BDR25DRAFT_349810 [Lindgomyces ingoldianus]
MPLVPKVSQIVTQRRGTIRKQRDDDPILHMLEVASDMEDSCCMKCEPHARLPQSLPECLSILELRGSGYGQPDELDRIHQAQMIIDTKWLISRSNATSNSELDVMLQAIDGSVQGAIGGGEQAGGATVKQEYKNLLTSISEDLNIIDAVAWYPGPIVKCSLPIPPASPSHVPQQLFLHTKACSTTAEHEDSHTIPGLLSSLSLSPEWYGPSCRRWNCALPPVIDTKLSKRSLNTLFELIHLLIGIGNNGSPNNCSNLMLQCKSGYTRIHLCSYTWIHPPYPTPLTKMRFVSILFLPLLPSLASTFPNPVIQPRGYTTTTASLPEIPTLHVTDFGAFISSSSNIPSYVSFHVQDPRPQYHAEVDCIFVTDTAYPSIYLEGYWPCEGGDGIAFWLDEDFMKIRRPFLQDPNDPKSYAVGLTKQDTYWAESTLIGSCANVTTSRVGKFYARSRNWDFPINQIIA